MRRGSIFLTIFATLLQGAFLPVVPTMAKSCDDIKVIFADGSGAEIGGTDNNFLDFKAAVSKVLKRTNLSFDVYELGSEGYGGYKYPAAAIGTQSLKTVLTSVGAYFSAGEGYTYGGSVDQGVGEVLAYQQEVSARCPKTKYILGGFSQGAGVISEAITKMDSNNIIYVATFGDAKLYLPEGGLINPPACRGENLSPYREYVPDCKVYEGILGGRNPYQPDSFAGKLGVWCNYHDTICSKYINWLNLDDGFDPHGSYGNAYNADHLYEKAAEKIYQKVVQEYGLGHSSGSSSPQTQVKEDTQAQNVAILIDSTGSMRHLIDTYKQEAKNLAAQVLDEGGKVALYEYRDLSDGFASKKHCDFESCTLEVLQTELDKIKTDGGGDDPESVLAGSLNAMNELNWEKGAKKSLVVLTDAEYHPMEVWRGQTITQETVVQRSLEIDPVNFYTITPDDIMSEYADLVEQTGGRSFSSVSELTESTEFIFKRPNPKLMWETYYGQEGDEFYFDASATTADADIVRYEWDLDFDGEFEEITTEPFITKTYPAATTGVIQVKATDANGLFGTMSAQVVVEEKYEDTIPTLTDVNYTKISDQAVTVAFTSDAYRVVVVANDAVLGATVGREITVDNLDLSKANTITLIPYNEHGQAGVSETIQIAAPENNEHSAATTEDENDGGNKIKTEVIFVTANIDELADGDKYVTRVPKTPQCGRQ